MKNISVFSLFIFFLLSKSSFSQVNIISYPNDPIGVKEFKLKNGLTVFLTENHDSPKIFGAVIVKTGGKKDPADNTGMAHYLEHMLFKGTTEMGTIDYEKEKPLLDEINKLYDELGKINDPEKRKEIQKKINALSVEAAAYSIPNEMDRMISEIGGEDVNAFTTEEMTVYYNSFPGNQIHKWLDIYASRFTNPVFRLFQSELETVYEEKNISMDNPLMFVFEKYLEQFYKVHPYGQQTILGKTEHLKNPSLTAMYDYYNKWYVANNMALIISGDFNSEEIIPIIEKKFGSWRSAEIPKFPEFKESDFKGREFIKMRATPVSVGATGYRVPATSSNEFEILSVIVTMLSNEEGAGLLDELNNEGKLMSTFSYPLTSNDYSALIIAYTPKPFKQSLKKAEGLVMQQISILMDGEFDESLLTAAKTSLLKNIEYAWESNESRVLTICESFSRELTWGQYLEKSYKIKNVSKEDVINFSKKYFSDNRLVLYSKMGFSKKEKLPKPGFEPVVPKEEFHSAYYNQWKTIPETNPNPNFVDFENDIETTVIGKNCTLLSTKNSFNEIAEISFRFGIGKHSIANLKHVPDYITIANSKKYLSNQFKRELFEIGFLFESYVSQHEFIINLEGLEEHLDKALAITFSHLSELLPDENKIKKIISEEETETKISMRDPGYIAQVLTNYVVYDQNSSYLKDQSLSELKLKKAEELIRDFNTALNHEVTINYVGKKSSTEIAEKIRKNLILKENAIPKNPRVHLDHRKITENVVYVYEFKKALQSQINFYIDGRIFSLEDEAVINAFNNYFGGDMSSLVFQEIREFRSLAYSTYAYYGTPSKEGLNCYFHGFVGCQADKTNEAVEAMIELIRNMPMKPERWEGIKSSLIQKTFADRPGFRWLIPTVENWKYKGYRDDPSKQLIDAYKTMKFDQLTELWSKDIKSSPMAISIVGNTSAFDLERLKKFGKIVYVKENEILKK